METTKKPLDFSDLIELPEVKVGMERSTIWEIGLMLVAAVAISALMIIMTKKAFV